MLRKVLFGLCLLLLAGFLFAQEEPNEEMNEESNEEINEEINEAPKEEIKEEVKEDIKEEDNTDKLLKKIEQGLVVILHGGTIGSGFIISEDGYILTNGHVVSNMIGDRDDDDPKSVAKKITVKLYNEEKCQAKVIGFSLDPDVALIKIDLPHKLKPVELGDSNTVKSSQTVYAYGAPGGLKRTLTKGIVSNIERTDLPTYTKVIQTDAAINPGNSGGPLLTESGEVVGINTYGGGGEGIGYSIPINVAKVLKEQYLKHGYFKRADLPFFISSEVTDELGQVLGIDKGVLVSYVIPGSVADKAGLKNGDVIIEMNGNAVSAKNEAQLRDFLWTLTINEVGSLIKFKILRGNKGDYKEKIISGTLIEDEPAVEYNFQLGEIKELRYDDLGLGVKQMTTNTSLVYRLPNIAGVRVVRATGIAQKAGIMDRDIITLIDSQAINNVDQFKDELEKRLAKTQKYILITLQRKNETIKTAIKPSYQLSGKKIVVVKPEGEIEYMEMVNRFLISNGGEIIIFDDTKEYKKDDFDGILIMNGAKVELIFDSQKIHSLIKTAVKEKKVIGAVGAASIALINADSSLLEKKITTDELFSGKLTAKKANYTGLSVEQDGLITTTTGFDKKVMKQFLAKFRDSLK